MSTNYPMIYYIIMALKDEYHFHCIKSGTFLLVLWGGFHVLYLCNDWGEQNVLHLFLYDYALYQYDV